jgi:hypothetical protein
LDPAEIAQLIGELEERVERLRALYDQYFMGIERLEPTILRKDVDRRLWALRREQIRNTGLRFKLETTIQRYYTYQQYWQRIVREIENGTYQRDLGRAAQRFGENAVTAFGKRRQKMFEKGQAKRAERDAARPSEAPQVPTEGNAPPASESYDVAFEDSEMLVEQPPLSLDFGPVTPWAGSPPASARGAPVPSPRPRETGPAAGPFPRGPSPPPPPRPAREPNKLVAESAGTLREVVGPRAIPPQAPPMQPAGQAPPVRSLPKAAPPPPRSPAASRPEISPVAAAKPEVKPAAPGRPDEELSATRLRQIYGQYVDAKRKANESTAAITFEKVAANLRETATQLRAKTKGAIDFEVVLKNGKPVLKPVVKG